MQCCQLDEMILATFYNKENIVGKGENAVYHHFLLFLQCFQTAGDRSSDFLFSSPVRYRRIAMGLGRVKGTMPSCNTGNLMVQGRKLLLS